MRRRGSQTQRRWALGPQGRRELAALVRSAPLVALDYDGTLCAIRPRPELALPTARTLALLERVCRLFPTAIISGRAVADLAGRLGTARPDYLIGNHGLEPGPGLAEAARLIAAARKRLAPLLAGRPGIELEDKRYSLSLHYRRAARPLERRRELVRLAARHAPALRRVEGKRVLNLVPPGGDKGRALRGLLGLSARRRGLYVGDDLTDEDAFRLPALRVMSVRVGPAHASAARWYLRRRAEVDALLAELVRLKGASGRETTPSRIV